MLKEFGSDIVNKQDISSTMNAHFWSVDKDLASKIEAVPNPTVTRKYNLSPQSNLFNFETTWAQDIREATAKTKTPNSFGSDKILTDC